VGRTKDRVEIGDLVARYVEAVATADRALFRSVWADDSTWVVDGRGTFRGPDEITAQFWQLRERQELAVQRVVSGRAVIHKKGKDASGRWIIHSLTRTDGGGSELVGIYDDGYVKERGDWLFRVRAFAPLYRGRVALEGRVFAPPALPRLEEDEQQT
jgi:ketosteroid isomerase-like protein